MWSLQVLLTSWALCALCFDSKCIDFNFYVCRCQGCLRHTLDSASVEQVQLTSLEFKDVMAHFFSMSDFSSADLPSILIERSLTFCTASCPACLKLRIKLWGCTPSSTKGLLSRRNSPAKITTVVVPSPTCIPAAASYKNVEAKPWWCRQTAHHARQHASTWLVKQIMLTTQCSMHLITDTIVRFAQKDRRTAADCTSASCEREMSTKVLAAGCMISNNFMMVAPSFEIVTPCMQMQAKHLYASCNA